MVAGDLSLITTKELKMWYTRASRFFRIKRVHLTSRQRHLTAMTIGREFVAVVVIVADP